MRHTLLWLLLAATAFAAAEQTDPENLLRRRTNLRYLEGEAIRDAMLAISGQLDPKLGGPPVRVYFSGFMDGHGKPPRSGPLDGDGCRSIYTAVRRNFLQPMMFGFDTQIPFSTMAARRNVSNVPARAHFHERSVSSWSRLGCGYQRTLANTESTQRVQQMYLTAFNRPLTPEEITDANSFRVEQRAFDGADDPKEERAWADLAHVLFNVMEFIYLN